MRVLLVDVGNSRVKWRVDDTTRPWPSALEGAQALDRAWPGTPSDALPVSAIDTLAQRWSTAGPGIVDAAFVSNVASPEIDVVIARALAAQSPAASITRVTAVARIDGFVNGYADPAQLGSDRWLAALAAHRLWPDRALLVCGFGTATTIDLLLPTDATVGATFVGGLILPGVDTMRTALARGTARLPDRGGTAVDFADNTADAIESGGIAAQRGAVAHAWRGARERAREMPLECVVSGGARARVIDGWPDAPQPLHIVDDLVLRGLATIARGPRL